jgi:hypothetical protein
VTQWSDRFNEKFGNLTFEPSNDTHWGAAYVFVHESVTLIKWRIKITSFDSSQLYFDYTVNMCRLEIEKRSNIFLKLFVDACLTTSDFTFLKCPLKAGQYLLRKRQEVPKQREVDIPNLFPINIKIKIRLLATAKINQKIEIVYSADMVIEVSKK